MLNQVLQPAHSFRRAGGCPHRVRRDAPTRILGLVLGRTAERRQAEVPDRRPTDLSHGECDTAPIPTGGHSAAVEPVGRARRVPAAAYRFVGALGPFQPLLRVIREAVDLCRCVPNYAMAAFRPPAVALFFAAAAPCTASSSARERAAGSAACPGGTKAGTAADD